ncbi:hypothetical protein, partial [Rubrivirga sp.]|uniref:hypothetical protein n=1 Tax=Rubrivirga sp. TaxID=1885344 RepID=UPI003C7929E9
MSESVGEPRPRGRPSATGARNGRSVEDAADRPMDSARRFTTPEIEDVFARAAAAQVRDQEANLGLSMEELQAVGAEAGLDPVHVAAAARAVAEGEPDEG